jgi:deoxyribodipyrimidine photolyase-related protein
VTGVRGPLSFDLVTAQEVIALVRERFADRYGSLEAFDYPVTHADAQALWTYFLDYCVAGFGDCQDATAATVLTR